MMDSLAPWMGNFKVSGPAWVSWGAALNLSHWSGAPGAQEVLNTPRPSKVNL